MRRTETSVTWLDNLDQTSDLRRKRDSGFNQRMIQRSKWLGSSDRHLIISMFREDKSAREIAESLDQPPRQVRKQIKQIVHRLNDPRLAYVIEHHKEWTKTRREIAHSLFIEGRSMRETTDKLGVSFYSVRKHRDAIDAMCHASIARSSQSNTSPTRLWRSSTIM
jgi:DNA-binding CsgD family transcriptional regulator